MLIRENPYEFMGPKALREPKARKARRTKPKPA